MVRTSLFPAPVLEEGVGPLGGEARLVLPAQDPVRQRELDLGVLRGNGSRVR